MAEEGSLFQPPHFRKRGVLGLTLLITIYGLCSLWHHHYSSWTKTLGARYQRCLTESSSEELEKLNAEAVAQDGGV